MSKGRLRPGSGAYYAVVGAGGLGIVAIIGLTVVMALKGGGLNPQSFQVPKKETKVATPESTTKKKQLPVRRQSSQTGGIRVSKPNTSPSGLPTGPHFNTRCYTYVMHRCNLFDVDPDLCMSMAKFASKLPEDMKPQACAQVLAQNFPDQARVFGNKKPKNQQKVATVAVPPSVQVVNEDGQMVGKNQPHKTREKAKEAVVKTGATKKHVLSPQRRKELLGEAYVLMNQAHMASLTYAESPQQRTQRLKKLRRIISQLDDPDLKKAYNSLVKQVVHRGAASGVEGTVTNAADRGIDEAPKRMEPSDLRIIKKKMQAAGVTPPSLTPQIEQPVDSATISGGTAGSASSSLPAAPSATPIQ